MDQKKIGDKLYVFATTPYTITQDTDASVIFVQEELLQEYKALNPTLTNIEKINYRIFVVNKQEWMIDDEPEPEHDYSRDYLTFVPQEDCFFELSNHEQSIEYSLDDGASWNIVPQYGSIAVQHGSWILWKNDFALSGSPIGTFTSTGRFTVEGNIMSLLYGDDFIGKTDITDYDYIFENLFANTRDKLVDAEHLVLPATTLATACYTSMFRDCTSITKAPVLPAAVLKPFCYNTMFAGCTNLNYIKCLATSGIADTTCTTNWLVGVANSGTFVKDVRAQDWTDGFAGIPSGWTVVDA